MKDTTIIGAGPVGLFGAFYAGLRGMSVRVIDSLYEPGGQLAALYPEKYVYDMPGFPEILARDLAHEMVKQANRFEVEWVFGETCRTLDPCSEGWVIGTEKGEYATRTVVLCAGVGSFTPTKLGVEREEDFVGRGLSYGVQDKSALKNKRVVIVGGGDSALDWALALENWAAEVTLVHRRDGFRAHEDSIRKLHASTVHLRTWEVVTALHGESVLTGVTTLHKQTGNVLDIECDALVVNVGYKSSLGAIRDWGLAIEKNKIVVDSTAATNLPGVFAAGDVCTHSAKLDLIATGVGEVCTAVNFAKVLIDPSAKAFPGHSSDMTLPSLS